jgi:hypothetical protein
MGENYLTEQVDNATKRRDRSRLEEDTPKLFLRPDIIDVVYDGTPVDGDRFVEGEHLLARASDEGERIDLIRCNRLVGRIEGGDAGKLHAELNNPENGTMVRVQVSNVSSLSGGADVTIIRE